MKRRGFRPGDVARVRGGGIVFVVRWVRERGEVIVAPNGTGYVASFCEHAQGELFP